ncbi:ureidoglycolate hydrolase [Viridothelium virens]|uniref:Ureidoglycolate hydrolase n=1 Tax=Viridothelium virens TaxID=1048519 RepID=A0A6A6HN17_VIRVR|nr:ureidoglycolate hydrolase [Viridothelium virens]
MPQTIAAPQLRIPVEPLTQSSFAPFGNVIDASKSAPLRDSSSITAVLKPTSANQGTATKYAHVTRLTNFYDRSRSKTPSQPNISLFVCQPRHLDPSPTASTPTSLFNVSILERHPFTSQTFIPLGTSSSYLVIVAPSLPGSTHTKARSALSPYPTDKPKPTRARSIRELFSLARPEPFTNSGAPPDTLSAAIAGVHAAHRKPAGPGLPDLEGIRAFWARGDQAVTYAAGVWHAPMAVVGDGEAAFVVVQNVSGVAEEDCQEVVLEGRGEGREGVAVELEVGEEGEGRIKAKL